MAGILVKTLLDGISNTNVYTVTNGKTASITISVLNVSAADAAKVFIALSANTTTPNTADYIEYGASIPSTGVLERAGIIAPGNTNIIAKSSANTIVLTIYGFEE